MNGRIRHGSAEEGLNQEFGKILESNHRQQIVRRNRAQEGNQHKRQGVEQIANHRTSDGAYPQALAFHFQLDALHYPGIGQLAQQKSHQRAKHDAWHIGEDMVISHGSFRQIIGRREPNTNLRTCHHQEIAKERQPNHLLGRTKSPQLGEHIAQHVGKGKGDGSCIEIKEVKKINDLDGHHVRHQIERNKSADTTMRDIALPCSVLKGFSETLSIKKCFLIRMQR